MRYIDTYSRFTLHPGFAAAVRSGHLVHLANDDPISYSGGGGGGRIVPCNEYAHVARSRIVFADSIV